MAKPTTIEEYIPLVREDLMDYGPDNYILESEEFSPKNIQRALDKALDRFNWMTPPMPDFAFNSFPAPGIIIDMAIMYLLRSSALKRLRNTTQFSDAGLSIDDQNWKGYHDAYRDLMSATIPEARATKASLNISTGGFKRVASVYNSQ